MTANTPSAESHSAQQIRYPKLHTWLTLGRVSNLPTVWANVLAGFALAATPEASLQGAVVFMAMLALTAAYLGGMLLNDVCDINFDKKHKPTRPIANGDVSLGTVRIVAILLLSFCVLAISYATWLAERSTPLPTLAALMLVACIILYNLWHKNNPISPVIMGACRVLIYVTCAYLISDHLSHALLLGAALLWLYLIGLTYTAKQEHLNRVQNAWPLLGLAAPLIWGSVLAYEHWLAAIPLLALLMSVAFALRNIVRRNPGDVPVAVVTLIAAMALWDGVLLFAAGFPALAMIAILCWLLTLALQFWVSGT